MNVRRLKNSFYVVSTMLLFADAIKIAKEEVDKAIEDEITQKLGEDLLQSIEWKFQVDLQRSVDMVLIKIKLLLQNGTHYIQDRLLDVQASLENIRAQAPNELDACLIKKQNDTVALAEKALHQMVVCGYALIGHDPSRAVMKVVALKDMIKREVKPIYEQKEKIYDLIKVCGHEHDSLKKVVKCVMSKSPVIKSAMMEISGKLIDGVVELTKLMAHGAMHEACLIEVVRTVEDEAVGLIKDIADCALSNTTLTEAEKFIHDNNATVLDIDKRTHNENVQEILRRMLDMKTNKDDPGYKHKLMNMHKEAIESNIISNDVLKFQE